MLSLLLLKFSRNRNKMNKKSNVTRMAIITQFSFNKAYWDTKDFAHEFRTQVEEMEGNEKTFAYGFKTLNRECNCLSQGASTIVTANGIINW